MAYLRVIFPDQRETIGYKLCIIDRDGSNRKYLFPEEDMTGLDSKYIAWSPEPLPRKGDFTIAFIYHGNIWLACTATGEARQITSDGLTSRIDGR